MSNLSDIGFPVTGDEDVNQILIDVLPHVESLACPPYGYYYRYSDGSGAEIFLQANPSQDLIGFNPGFGKAATVELSLLSQIDRDTSELDGGFVAAAGNDSVFVFDSPCFRGVQFGTYPTSAEVGLTAFASNDLEIIRANAGSNGGNYIRPLKDAPDYLVKGIFEGIPPQPHVTAAMTVSGSELMANGLTGAEFRLIKAESGFGEISVVADLSLAAEEPVPGDVVRGSFWLSGQVSG